jgi:segregation and condensation protein A
MLLPVEDREEFEEEEDDPRWELVRQLVEYKKYKDAANRLQEQEFYQEHVFALGADNVVLEPDEPGVVLQDVSLFDLITAFNDVLKRAKPEEIGEIFADRFTVADKIDDIVRVIGRKRKMPFRSLFGKTASRHEVICTFLALLELIRLRQVQIDQRNHFGEIVLSAVEEQDMEVEDAAE